jgi:dipeptidase
MLTYAADSHTLYGELYLTPAGRHAPGALRDVVEWDTGKLLGRIPQAPVTYQTLGNMNEHQVVITETTWGGRKELAEPSGIIDYGSLIWIALERSKTAREAILTMAALLDEHGYASTGESFSLSDPNEVWLMEVIGKGKGRKGAVWAARRVPDGALSAHANQARIRTFPLADPAATLYAKDVIAFAREMGWFAGRDEDFSFADAYAPLDFGGRRFCEARVWSVFRRAAPSLRLPVSMIQGDAKAERLPLWVEPDRKLGVADVMALMRDHFEGTELEMTKDVGAGPFALPYRWRPMTFEVDGGRYVHERAISTQQTGYSLVSQSRGALPDPIGGVLWFGVDDTYSTVYMPMYAGMKRVPRSLAVGTADFSRFSWDSAFWVFNFVSNWAYSRYADMIVDIRKVQGELEAKFLADQAEVEKVALDLHARAPGLARDYLTDYSVRAADETVARWRALGESLVWRYLDGNVRDSQGKVTHAKYPDSWYRRIVSERGDSLRDTGPPD